ncbi:hypothetical protein GCM10008985_15520 [Halococcus dombrowskii]|uniref:SWIM-type domain-containing protein n=2 Tax=Halococcus dombrowskii TaxID=179637 RepID=A0AAV3SGR0_HALDO
MGKGEGPNPTMTEATDATLDVRTDDEIEMDALTADERRAVRARSESMVVIPQTDPDGICIGMYDVHSESGERYTIILDHDSGCDCPDTEYNGAENCKHRRRVAMQINESGCPAPGQPLGDYQDTLKAVRTRLEDEREALTDELETVDGLLDGLE